MNSFFLFLLSGAKGGLLDVNPGLIFWTIVTFIILLVLLKKVAWKPIIEALEEREKFIKESLEKAEKAQKEAERLSEENKKLAMKAEEEARKIREENIKELKMLVEKKLAEAEEKANQKIKNAEAEIERKYQEAFLQLKNEVADLAIAIAEKILKENLDKEKNKKIAQEYLEKITSKTYES
jgi:F-type H+-transporting ATPase subunit b